MEPLYPKGTFITSQERQELVKKLIVRIADGDSQAFAAFYEFYYSRVFFLSQKFLKSERECREIVADVFFYLWLNRKKLPGLINIDGYLYSAVKNQSLKYLKKNKLLIHSQIDQFSYDFFIENNTPESILLSDELKTIFDAAVKNLPNRCREIFILVKEEGLKYKEVAEKLSISHRTVQAQVMIATKKILLFIKQKYQSGLTPKIDM